MKIYHNNNCSKSRATLDLLQKQNLYPEVINYLDMPPSKKELLDIIALLNIKAIDLVRKGEQAFLENNLNDESLTDEQVVDIMIDHPILIERPIVIHNGKAAIGRPIQNVIDIL